MKHVLWQIGKHSSIYMFSQIVLNSLSVLMLPIYLRYFTPEEFGGMALIDLTTGLFTAALANGLMGAMSRFHFEEKTEDGQRTVWWTGLALVAGTMTLGSGVLFILAGRLSHQLLGPDLPNGPLWMRLAAVSMWIDMQSFVVAANLRARKRSATIMTQTILRSLIFVGCAAPGIIVWKLGPTAMFTASLVAAGTVLLIQYAQIAWDWGRPRFSLPVLKSLWHYGWPMLVIGVLMIILHSLNRWFVRDWISVSQVGLLSLGIQVADKVNRLIVMPFQQIWGMLIFELHEEHPENAIRTYCVVFELFCYALISVFFGCSIVAGPVLSLFARTDYLGGVPLIPTLCLAQFCFALHEHFLAPVRLSKQTHLILPAAVAGILVACLANAWLIPIYGVFGAAWATVATYAVYSATNLLMARQVAVYPYAFLRIGAILAGVCGTFAAFESLEPRLDSQWFSLGIGLALWLTWSLIMAAISYRRFREATLETSTSQAADLPMTAIDNPAI